MAELVAWKFDSTNVSTKILYLARVTVSKLSKLLFSYFFLVIELIHSQPSFIQSFQTAIQNGKLNMKETFASDKVVKEYSDDGVYNDTTEVVIQKSDIDFATSFTVQFSILLSRMFLQMRRNRLGLYIQFFHHLLSGLIIGGIFYGIGNDAAQTIAIFKYCVCINVFFMYTHVMMPVLLCKFGEVFDSV